MIPTSVYNSSVSYSGTSTVFLTLQDMRVRSFSRCGCSIFNGEKREVSTYLILSLLGSTTATPQSWDPAEFAADCGAAVRLHRRKKKGAHTQSTAHKRFTCTVRRRHLCAGSVLLLNPSSFSPLPPAFAPRQRSTSPEPQARWLPVRVTPRLVTSRVLSYSSGENGYLFRRRKEKGEKEQN